MTPKVPQTNLFQLELRNLTDTVNQYGAWAVEHKWWLIGAAAILIILFFRHFRGNRQ